MKRLLAYLFIVLGLGLTFNVNAKADAYYIICDNDYSFTGRVMVLKSTSSKSKNRIVSKCENPVVISNIDYITFGIIGGMISFPNNHYPESYCQTKDGSMWNIYKKHKYFKLRRICFVDRENMSKILFSKGYDNKFSKIAKVEPKKKEKKVVKKSTSVAETQIAKAEPSQTQGVAKLKSRYNFCFIKQKNINTLFFINKRHECAKFKANIIEEPNEFIYIWLTKLTQTDTWGPNKNRSKQERFDDQIQSLFLDFYTYKIDEQLIYDTIKNNSELASLFDKSKIVAETADISFCVYGSSSYVLKRFQKCWVKYKTVSSGDNNYEYFLKRHNIKEPTQTQIAKAEPSQTQTAYNETNNNQRIDLIFCKEFETQFIFEVFIKKSHQQCPNSYPIEVDYKEYKQKINNIVLCFNNIRGQPNILKTMKWRRCEGEYSGGQFSGKYTTLKAKFDGKNIFIFKKELPGELDISLKKTQIAKAEEPKQEIFKPEDKDIDNDAPVIEIAEAITVVNQSYTIKGTVKDKSKQIYLEINGRPVEVKKGKFELDRFNIDPDVVEELKIVAIDQWNNRSEKIVKVTVELKDTQMVKSYEELKPNKVKVKTDKDKIAIIIGIEKYVNLENLDAPFANRDAKAFRTYATRALGVKSANIKLLVDDKAARPQILEAFKLWLPRIAADGGKDIYIFFSGHGLASDDGEDLYILPQNGYANLLDDTAITRVELISLIQKVNPKSVTMFFDTCYSGQTREERMLVASLKPIRIVAEEQDTPDNFTVFSASNFDQTSGTIKEAKQGMFSYYLMKGLEWKADNNKDKKITNGELIAYLKTNVSKEAFTQNREQDPMLSGDPDKILMSYR